MKSSLKSFIFFYAFLSILINIDIFSCKFLNKKLKSFADDDEIATITTDNETELMEAIDILYEKGGTIYIDTPVINLKESTLLLLDGDSPGGIIGIRQSNGEYPRINFVQEETEDLFNGIYLFSNKFIEYMIIENSLNDGIVIIGDNNILDHVISRYNYGSGFVTFGNFNTFNYCYSYRNFDGTIFSVESDGFKISGELNNVFNYCFAWDNGNSGFNYVRSLNSSDLSYLHSGSWNNGNIAVFTGKYDYDNGSPLDKNLWTIQEIIKSDPNFVSNYYNKKYNVENAYIGRLLVDSWTVIVEPKMEGNGFTFGNRNSSQSIDVKRNSFYNVVFDHKSGGFIDNFNHKYNAFFTDCVSFNNKVNYRLTYTFSRWINNWSWGSNNKDQLNGDVKTKEPNNPFSAQRSSYSVRDQIIKSVSANMFPDGINFDRTIASLRE